MFCYNEGYSDDEEESYVETVLYTNKVTTLPMVLSYEDTDYNFVYDIVPYGNGYKTISKIQIKDKLNKLLYICDFNINPIFWKKYVTTIKFKFIFNEEYLKKSSLVVTLKSSPQVGFSDYITDKYIVNRLENDESGAPIFLFKVDPISYKKNQRLYNTYQFGGKSKKRKYKKGKSRRKKYKKY